MQQKK